MNKTALTLAGLSLLIAQSLHAAPLRIAADPVPHAEILEYVKQLDPKLDLDVIEL
ncbi:MAG: metal ABC transporter substrate-binding protein, partial [Mixta calida]|nr:metal ABC transporter substrate-binding protein [Mixta calida]